jgi:integrase/recombinase XerD
MEPLFEQFIRERQYLANVTPATIEWYERCFKWLPSASPTQEQLKEAVLRMRAKGLKATGVNLVLRGLNAYMHWTSGSERKCGAGCTHPRIQRLKEPQNILPTFTDGQVKQLIAWRPKAKCQRRLHFLTLFLLDTGCRISEALGVRVRDIDFNNLLVTLDGKGRRQRVVPFSFELRRALFHHCKESSSGPDNLLFANRSQTGLDRRNISRNVRALCRELGFNPPCRTVHAMRHTFALNYLRRGGSVFHLQKVLGHSTLEMTRRYASLGTADLQAMHERVSLLSK